MSTCGYICPSCNGTKLTDEGFDCEWCIVAPSSDEETTNEESTTNLSNGSK
jgi:hypothetical protein